MQQPRLRALEHGPRGWSIGLVHAEVELALNGGPPTFSQNHADMCNEMSQISSKWSTLERNS